jgi:hypothetical protein
MKTDTQHLDYLFSQYVDGCVDAASRKSLEQKLVMEPKARELYQDHREVQELLDDWGNRIPLINWDEFDQKLAKRLENENVGGQRTSLFRQWLKPLSIAASLALAVSLGYGWHAWSTPTQITPINIAVHPIAAPARPFSVEEFTPGQGSIAKVSIDEGVLSQPLANNDVNVTAPGNVEAADSLKESLTMSLPSLEKSANPAGSNASSVHVAEVIPQNKRDNKSNPQFP